jgi:PAS domain S-box-containing protein
MSTREFPTFSPRITATKISHVVQFYSHEDALVHQLSDFVGMALAAGSSAVVIATKGHEDRLSQRLRQQGLDLKRALALGRYVPLDASETLSMFMVAGMPEASRFVDVMSRLIARASAAADDASKRVVAFGEMVSLLFAEGRSEAAIRLEKLWNQLARSQPFSLYCAYPSQGFCREEHADALLKICAEHSEMMGDEKVNHTSGPEDGRTPSSPLQPQIQGPLAKRESHLKEEQFRLFMEVVPDYAIFMLDPQGRVSTWNAGAARIKGYSLSEIIGRHFSCFYPWEDALSGKPQRLLDLAVKNGHVQDEGWRVRKDGTLFWANVTIVAVRDHGGKLLGFGKVTHDLSEKRRAELALSRSEDQFRLMAEAVRDYAIFMLDPDGHISSWNRGAERIKGYSAAEILGRHFSCFYPEDEVRAGKPARELREALQNGRLEDEGWRRRKDGSLFWANVIITPVRNSAGKLLGFAKVTRDMSEKMQKERSLRELSLHVLRMQDEERKRIGRDLHDTLGQCVTAMKIGLDTLASSVGENDAATTRQIKQCVSLAEECVREVRTLSYLLYPPMLEEMGLQSAISWYLEGFATRSGIQATFDASDYFGRLSRETELALFRVLQESLTNVHRHSGSKTAHVRLSKKNGSAILEISDQGRGFAADVLEEWGKSWQRAVGVGLRGMRERLERLGGSLEIASERKGAKVIASVPVSSGSLEVEVKATRETVL